MKTRASHAKPISYFFLRSLLRASWHKFCCKPPTHHLFLMITVRQTNIYNPPNDGVWFFKTMGFISQNGAYIWWVEQGLNRICSMLVQWLFNACSMVVTMRCLLRCLLRAWTRFVFFWNEEEILPGMSGMGVNGREWGKRLPAFLMKFLGQIKAIT